MKAHSIRNRLAALVGQAAAIELLETPNLSLDGKTPDELLNKGITKPVEHLLYEFELQHRVKLDFQAGDTSKATRSKNGTSRVLSLLDEIQVEELRSQNFEQKGARS